MFPLKTKKWSTRLSLNIITTFKIISKNTTYDTPFSFWAGAYCPAEHETLDLTVEIPSAVVELEIHEVLPDSVVLKRVFSSCTFFSEQIPSAELKHLLSHTTLPCKGLPFGLLWSVFSLQQSCDRRMSELAGCHARNNFRSWISQPVWWIDMCTAHLHHTAKLPWSGPADHPDFVG